MQCIQYSKDYLEEKDTGNLGRLYIERFIVSKESPGQNSQLELILEVLSQRPAEEIKDAIQQEISIQLVAAAERKDHLMVYLLQEVKQHFQRIVS